MAFAPEFRFHLPEEFQGLLVRPDHDRIETDPLVVYIPDNAG